MGRVRIIGYSKPCYLRQSDDCTISELSKYLGISKKESLCLFVNASRGTSQVVETKDISDINFWKLEHLGFDIKRL